MNETVMFIGTVRSVRVTWVPGDTLRRLIADAVDADGRVWPAGTEFRPLSGGYDNNCESEYRLVTVQS